MAARRAVLDLTRLVKRADAPAPSGIDRVELAYALALSRRLGERLTFCVRVSNLLSPLPRTQADSFLYDLLAGWSTEGEPIDPALREPLAPLLGSLLDTEDPGSRVRRSLPTATLSRRLAWFARGRIGTAGRAFAPEVGSAFLSLSHDGLTRNNSSLAFCRRHGLDPIYFLHDLIPITHPEFARAGDAARHRERIETMLMAGHLILVNSAYTRDVLQDYAANEGIACPPTLVVHLGVEPFWSVPAVPVYRDAPPYFVHVGTIEPRKNHLLLLNVWRRMAETVGPSAPKLVVLGRRGWENENILDMLDRCEPLRGLVIECGQLPDRLLLSLVRGATALLFPSMVEGFGLPLVEALAAGTPVLASDIPPFREVGGDVPDYLDPLDGIGWMRRILDYAAPGSPARSAQIARMAGYAPPSWEDHIDRVCDAVGL